MPKNVYDLGDVVRLRAIFDDTTQNVDPSEVVFSIKTPLGTVSNYQYGVNGDVGKTATGNYFLDYAPTHEGTYYYRAQGKVTNRGSAENYFIVRQSYFN